MRSEAPDYRFDCKMSTLNHTRTQAGFAACIPLHWKQHNCTFTIATSNLFLDCQCGKVWWDVHVRQLASAPPECPRGSESCCDQEEDGAEIEEYRHSVEKGSAWVATMYMVRISLLYLDLEHEECHVAWSELKDLAVCCQDGQHLTHPNWLHLHFHPTHYCEYLSYCQELVSELLWRILIGQQWKWHWYLLKTSWNCYDGSPIVNLHHLYLGQMRIWILKTRK